MFTHTFSRRIKKPLLLVTLAFCVFVLLVGEVKAGHLDQGSKSSGSDGSSQGLSQGRDDNGSRSSGSFTTDKALADFTTKVSNALLDGTYQTATTYSPTEGWGYSTIEVNPREGSSGGSFGGGNTPVSSCDAQPNLITVDIFFVPTGAQPVTTPEQRRVSMRNGTRPDDRVTTVIPASTSYAPIMVPGNQLEVGLSYEPIVMMRNSAPCTAPSRNGGGGSNHEAPVNYGPRTWLPIPVAYAGGGSSQPNDYPNYFRTQLPFGSKGSFPIRVRIDVGSNNTYESEYYINSFGPLQNGQTGYLRLPAFTTAEVGSHRIEVVTDIRHNVDPGRTCYATTTPASAGWGCVRETSETDNDRSEVFTTGVGSTSLQIAVDVSDMIKRANTEVTEVPFITTNNGRATISNYRYRVTIGSTLFSSSTQTTSLLPTSQETVRSTGTYTTPNLDTTLPLTVCAQVATTTEVCDTARLIVGVPQCSDSRDNDGDGVQDSSDPSCFGDPLDPTSYDPDDNNEGDLASTSASVTIEFKPVTNPVRYDTSATLAYIINGPAPMSCVVTGGGTNTNITHTPPRTAGQVMTAPVTSTQQFWLRCTATLPGGSLQFERTTTVDVLPLIQET